MAGRNVYTLKDLSEQILRIINENRPTGETKLEKREISKQLRHIAAELIHGRWFEMKQTGELKHLSPLLLATFDEVPVEVDDDSEENYIDLPAIPEDLQDGTGIQNIRPQTGNFEKDQPMIPIPVNADILLQQLPTGAIEQRFGFTQRGYKVFFTERSGRTLEDEKITEVQVRMITVGPEHVADEDPFPFPNDLIPELIKRTLAIFSIADQKEADLINDNA